MNLPLILISPSQAHLHGATSAQDQFARIFPALNQYRDEDSFLALDCSAAQSITASFIRGTVHRAFLCGQAEVRQTPAVAGSDISPLKLYPVVTGCNPEIRDAIHEFFVGRGCPILEIKINRGEVFRDARLLGTLDPILRRTLKELSALGEAAAGDLAAQSEESISINGWNNRLADLLLLRLVTRRRRGKFWFYSALVKEIMSWA